MATSKRYEQGDTFEAKASNLKARCFLMRKSDVADVWKWELEFTSDRTVPDTWGWASTLNEAKAKSRECAELFCGAGNLGKFSKVKQNENSEGPSN